MNHDFCYDEAVRKHECYDTAEEYVYPYRWACNNSHPVCLNNGKFAVYILLISYISWAGITKFALLVDIRAAMAQWSATLQCNQYVRGSLPSAEKVPLYDFWCINELVLLWTRTAFNLFSNQSPSSPPWSPWAEAISESTVQLDHNRVFHLPWRIISEGILSFVFEERKRAVSCCKNRKTSRTVSAGFLCYRNAAACREWPSEGLPFWDASHCWLSLKERTLLLRKWLFWSIREKCGPASSKPSRVT